MITLFIKSYLTVLLSIGAGCLTIFLLGMFLIIKSSVSGNGARGCLSNKPSSNDDAISHNITAIAGEDVMATQLDLARAYIEINQKSLAQTILELVLKQGSLAQQEEARHLLSYLQS